jgi:hypothetical protein
MRSALYSCQVLYYKCQVNKGIEIVANITILIIFLSIFIVSVGEKSMSQDLSAWESPYFVEKGEKPYMFYTVFGVTPEDLKPSRAKHNVDSIPEGLDARFFHKDRH